MKISELIKKLQEIQKEHGDLEVHVHTDYYDVTIDCFDFNIYGCALYIE